MSRHPETDPRVDLLALPRSELRDALEPIVTAEFRQVLLMDETDELDLGGSFFDLGLTSLRLLEIKQRLEDVCGRPLDTTVLFNRPTVEQLVDHLADELAAADGVGAVPRPS